MFLTYTTFCGNCYIILKKGVIMGTTQPLKNINDIEKLKEYFRMRGKYRDFALVMLGLNTALRIGDILSLHWKDVYDFKCRKFHTHIQLHEQKTGKYNYIYINAAAIDALENLRLSQKNIYPEKVLFESQKGVNMPLSRYRAYTILKEAGQKLGLGNNFSCHSLRKTFGYHAWKNGESPIVIMTIFNHSSFEITKRYLSIEQDDKDMLYARMQF